MRRIFAILSALLLLASCTKEAADFNQTEKFAFYASAGTKTSLSENEKVLWSDGDALTVFDGDKVCGGHKFTGTVDLQNRSLCHFEGEVCAWSDDIVALYPYNENATFDGSCIRTAIPATQSMVAGSFCNASALSLGRTKRSSGDAMTFANLCSVISFSTPSYIEDIVKIDVETNSAAKIAGNVEISLNDRKITSCSGSSKVTVEGQGSASSRYYAVIAPVCCTNGFKITVTTTSGAQYVCTTTKTIDAQAGDVYYLGTLGLKLAFTPTVTITHTKNASGEISGSDAVLSISGLDDELSGKVASWSVELKKDGVSYRRINSTSGKMSTAGGWIYIPQGTYDIEASYTLPDGKMRTVKATAKSPAPEIQLTTTGYTSYNYGVGYEGISKNVNTANSLNGSTIYNLSTKVNVAKDPLNDSKNSSNYIYSVDGNTATAVIGNSLTLGNLENQSWSTHTFATSFTFDGVSRTATRNLHVTGLPWRDSAPTSARWELTTNASTRDNSWIKLGGGTGTAEASLRNCFYAPANINLSVYCAYGLYSLYWYVTYQQTTFTITVGGSQILSRQSERVDYEKTYSDTKNASISPSGNSVLLKSSYTLAGPYVAFYDIKFSYR